MPDENVVQPVTEEIINKAEDEVGAGFWGPTVTNTPVTPATDEPPATPAAVAPVTPASDEEIIEPKEWLKREFNVEDAAVLKAQLEELNTLKSAIPKPYEYKNEESRKIAEYINEGKEDELYQFLDTKKKVQKLSTADLSDKSVAAELVKFGLHKDNPTLNQDEIDFLFNEKYSIPPKPVKEETDDDTDYEIKLGAWEIQKSNIEKRMVIEAKIAQPKMAQLNTELVLPEIVKENKQTVQPTPEELEKAKKVQESFLTDVESGLKNLVEESVMVKDEVVEIPVSYAYTDDERKVVLEQVRSFVSNNYDTNEIFGKMWTDKDGNIDIPRMVRDLAYLNSREKIHQKLANEGANKRLKEYTKDKKNIHLPGTTTTPNGQVDPAKALEEVEAAIWSR